jgi:hypothetical protein
VGELVPSFSYYRLALLAVLVGTGKSAIPTVVHDDGGFWAGEGPARLTTLAREPPSEDIPRHEPRAKSRALHRTRAASVPPRHASYPPRAYGVLLVPLLSY